MIDVNELCTILNLQAMDIGGKRVVDLKSVLYCALKNGMVDIYDLTESAKILNTAIANRCVDSAVKAKHIQEYAYGIEQFCLGRLYSDQDELDGRGKLQARNARTIIELTDEVLTENQSI